MKKRILLCLAILLISAIAALHAAAADNTPITVYLDGQKIDCESYGSPAIIVENRTLVPLRAIFEAIGATVEWDGSTRTATSKLDFSVKIDEGRYYKRDFTEIKLTVGSNTLYKNGSPVTLDVPATIINERTMVPARAIAESFGVGVSWDASTRTVNLSTRTPAFMAGAIYTSEPELPLEDLASGKLTTYVGDTTVYATTFFLSADGTYSTYSMGYAWVPADSEEVAFSPAGSIATKRGEYIGAMGAGVTFGMFEVSDNTLELYNLDSVYYWSTPELSDAEMRKDRITTYVGDNLKYGYLYFLDGMSGEPYTFQYSVANAVWKNDGNGGYYSDTSAAETFESWHMVEGKTIALHEIKGASLNANGNEPIEATLTYKLSKDGLTITDVACDVAEIRQKLLDLPTLKPLYPYSFSVPITW